MQLPPQITHLDDAAFQRNLQRAVDLAEENWGCSRAEAAKEIVSRLADNRFARRSFGSAVRYLRDIPYQDFEAED